MKGAATHKRKKGGDEYEEDHHPPPFSKMRMTRTDVTGTAARGVLEQATANNLEQVDTLSPSIPDGGYYFDYEDVMSHEGEDAGSHQGEDAGSHQGEIEEDPFERTIFQDLQVSFPGYSL